MADQINYAVSMAAEGGPTVEADDHFDAESFTKIEATIPKNSVATTVDLQPSEVAMLQAIIITATSYADLTYTVDEGVTVKTLDGPLMLVGAGNIEDHFGATCEKLVFTNANVTVDNPITILLARTAVE